MHILSVVSFALTMAMAVTFIYMNTEMYRRNKARSTQILVDTCDHSRCGYHQYGESRTSSPVSNG